MASEIKAPIAGSMTELPTSHVPFVRFDGVVSRGANHGVIQLELAAKIVEPDPTEKAGAKTQVVATAHLRCSSDAAADLKRAIDSALALAKRTPHGESRFAMVAGDRNIHAPRLPPFVITMPYDAPKRRKLHAAIAAGCR